MTKPTLPKPHNRAELRFKPPSAQLQSSEHFGLWAMSWHRKPGHPDPHPQTREQGMPAPRKHCSPSLGSWAPKHREGMLRPLDLGSRLVPALTSWAASGFRFPILPTQGDDCECSGVLPAPPSGVGLGVVTWRGARSREPGPARLAHSGSSSG